MDKGQVDKLSMDNLDVKQFIDWNQAYQQQQLTLNLQQLKSRLQAELAQSVETHVIRKEKNLQEISKGIEVILNIKQKTAQALQTSPNPNNLNHNQKDMPKIPDQEHNLDNLVQLITIKNHVDYCLEKLQPIVNNENNQENDQPNPDED